MLLRLWRRLQPRPAPPPSLRLEPVVDIAVYVPPPQPPRDPDPQAVSNHYPPLNDRLSRGDPDAACFWNELQPGDEVWAFHSPREDWQAKAGRKGVALVRSGRVVRSVVTMLN